MSMKEKNAGVRWYHLIDPKSALVVLLLFLIAIVQSVVDSVTAPVYPAVSLSDVPAYSGTPYVEVAENVPVFTSDEAVPHAFEEYAKLDDFGRCGTAYACVNQRLMPKDECGDYSAVTPSGFVNVQYDFIEDGDLYNRCHLIGYQLTGEDDNERNLITGTRYMLVEGMLPFENMVAEHIRAEGHHVLYRVVPIYDGNNLVASGVQMEAFCVECGEENEADEDKFMFNVFCYNVQPGVEINYATGESKAVSDEPANP